MSDRTVNFLVALGVLVVAGIVFVVFSKQEPNGRYVTIPKQVQTSTVR